MKSSIQNKQGKTRAHVAWTTIFVHSNSGLSGQWRLTQRKPSCALELCLIDVFDHRVLNFKIVPPCQIYFGLVPNLGPNLGRPLSNYLSSSGQLAQQKTPHHRAKDGRATAAQGAAPHTADQDLEEGALSPIALSDFAASWSLAGASAALSSALSLAGVACALENDLNDILHAFRCCPQWFADSANIVTNWIFFKIY